MIRNLIKETALSFVGQEEIRGNLGFKDAKFQQYMETMGWDKGQAWCAYFAELVWKKAYAQVNTAMVEKLDKLFNASAVMTYNLFYNSEFTTSSTPEVGDVVIWQYFKNGKLHWTGHAGIVIEVYGNSFKSVEGNSNDDGSREGYKVVIKERSFEPHGIILKGFIKPIEP